MNGMDMVWKTTTINLENFLKKYNKSTIFKGYMVYFLLKSKIDQHVSFSIVQLVNSSTFNP